MYIVATPLLLWLCCSLVSEGGGLPYCPVALTIPLPFLPPPCLLSSAGRIEDEK